MINKYIFMDVRSIEFGTPDFLFKLASGIHINDDKTLRIKEEFICRKRS